MTVIDNSNKKRRMGGGVIKINREFFLFSVQWATNAQLFHKLSHSYMFWHYRVILREAVINTLPSYTSTSNAAVGNTIYEFRCFT